MKLSLKYIHGFIANYSGITGISAAFFLLTAFGIFDFNIDHRINFSMFYVFPVILATWNKNFTAGMAFSFLSSCFWFAAAFNSYKPD